ncbi:DUF4278 domain-containing protein [Cyanobacteria bacterium FACHB-471]|nr:DUF4278 domain-containing protein [Cyanobacteria bacterium FACHB-471]
MLLTYRGSSYDSSATQINLDQVTTGHYRGSDYQLRQYAAMPQITQELKYRGTSYTPGVTRRSATRNGDTGWQPATA